ncbi:MAG TPA: DNA polymerase III subunit beta [Acholeplasmataceae bacterium]|jgi:DNA polymerase-3 subunit beta|nr:DNA polymerase III subunit beta [Acholeplasmataceae bacterium]
MIFSINRNVLLDNLLVIQRGLPNKTPLPILNAIKFVVNEDHLILTASNSDLAIELTIEDKSLKVKQTGKAAIPGRFLIEIIRKLEATVIEFAVVEDRTVVIKAERSDFKLNLPDVLDYPEVDFLDLKQPLVLDSEIIKTIIKETNYAAANTEKRPILTGVNFLHDAGQLFITATDSYRLSKKEIKIRDKIEPFNFVIPRKSLEELSKILDLVSENVEIYVNPNKVLFKFPNIMFQTRLLEGKYPDTSRIVPTDFPVVIPFNKEELLAAVERVSLLSPRDRDTNYNIIKLTLRPDHVVEISSTNPEVGDALEEITPNGRVVGTSMQIAFSSRYLIEALKSFASSDITISFAGEVRPFVIHGPLDIDLLHLILPVRID